jgi:hypothetical protein
MVTIRLLVRGPVSLQTCRPCEARVNGRVVLVRGFAVHHAARSELGAERRLFRVVRQFRLFLGIEVV